LATHFYLIPGLGADERIFQRLTLPGTVHCLRWLEPLRPDEPLADYAARLAAPIPIDQPCWLVGVSFGGPVALEIACQRPLARVVLVSSLERPEQRSGLVELGRLTRADVWVPVRLLRRIPWAGRWFFGVKGKRAGQVFAEILSLLSPRYTHWALGQLFRWKGSTVKPVAHLIGDCDRVFPAACRTASHVIRGGSHFMIVTHATAISRILTELATTGAGEQVG
jgi:pimeloyl-ACP methyl ester carboxylesterase